MQYYWFGPWTRPIQSLEKGPRHAKPTLTGDPTRSMEFTNLRSPSEHNPWKKSVEVVSPWPPLLHSPNGQYSSISPNRPHLTAHRLQPSTNHLRRTSAESRIRHRRSSPIRSAMLAKLFQKSILSPRHVISQISNPLLKKLWFFDLNPYFYSY